MSTYQTVIYEKKDRVARITLNRPDSLNAFNAQMTADLSDALIEAEDDDEVRVIVLAGAGRCFSAGADLKAMQKSDHPIAEAQPVRTGRHRGPYSLRHIPKICITQVHSYCLALGCECMESSDITIASDDAKFGMPEAKMGNSMTATPFYLMPHKRAKELLLSGEMWTAEEALRVGLINKVVPRERLQEEVDVYASRLSAISPAVVARIKALGNRVLSDLGYDATNETVLEPNTFIPRLQTSGNDSVGVTK